MYISDRNPKPKLLFEKNVCNKKRVSGNIRFWRQAQSRLRRSYYVRKLRYSYGCWRERVEILLGCRKKK